MRVNANAVLRSWTLLAAFGGSYAPGYSYMIAASGLRVIHEWLRFYRVRGRSPSGLSKRKPRVYYP